MLSRLLTRTTRLARLTTTRATPTTSLRLPRACVSWFSSSSSSSVESESPIPIISLAPFASSSSSEAEKAAVVSQVRDACENIGFMIIKDHGVSDDLISRMETTTKTFFDSPLENKADSAVAMSDEYPYGYVGFMHENLASGYGESDTPPDLNESFACGPSNPAAGLPPRRWPQQPAEMAAVWDEYYTAMEGLAGSMMQACALALELPEMWFADKVDHHRSAIRALNYPKIENDPAPGQVRAGAHTDYGAITILLQDPTGGLEVIGTDRDGGWIPVPYIPNSYVINLGDLMPRWTNEKWVSTIHRVVYRPKRRQSIAFFYNINHDHLVECIPTCHDENNPPKYEPILFWDHLMSKHSKAVASN